MFTWLTITGIIGASDVCGAISGVNCTSCVTGANIHLLSIQLK